MGFILIAAFIFIGAINVFPLIYNVQDLTGLPNTIGTLSIDQDQIAQVNANTGLFLERAGSGFNWGNLGFLLLVVVIIVIAALFITRIVAGKQSSAETSY